MIEFHSLVGLMGVKTKILVNQVWQEPAILWSLVAAPCGSKKTAALRQILNPLVDIQREQYRQWHLTRPTSHGNSVPTGPPKLFAGNMSLEDVEHVMMKNNGQIFILSEDCEDLHKQIGVSAHGDTTRRNKLAHLYEGLPSFSVTNGDIVTLDATCFNNVGMASPRYVVDFVTNHENSMSGLYLVSCPPTCDVSPSWTSVPLSTDTPSIKDIFQTLFMYHQQTREYAFSPDAWRELCRYQHEEWSGWISQFESEDHRRNVIGKTMGQTVRLAGIIKALNNACEYCGQKATPDAFQWDLKIDVTVFRKALELSRYFLKEKLALLMISGFGMSEYSSNDLRSTPIAPYPLPQTDMPVTNDDFKVYVQEEEHVPFLPEFMTLEKGPFLQTHGKRIKRLLECYDDGNGVSATTACQRSIAPPVRQTGTNNRHPAWASALFFRKVAELDLGTADQTKSGVNRKYFWRFRRNRPHEVTNKIIHLLEYLKVDMTLYNKIGARSPVPHMSDASSPITITLDITEDPDTLSNDNEASKEYANAPKRKMHRDDCQVIKIERMEEY